MKRIEKMVKTICCVALLFITTGSIAFERSAAKELMIVFTHDLHSYFLPHRILTEQDNQMQQGGYAKLAYLIKGQQMLQSNKTIVVDAGDFSMGTLFHTSFMQEASELRLMGKMGYDVVTLGNHDFDFHADGLATMLQTAKSKSNQLPAMIASNIIFSKNDPGDATLKQAFRDYPVKEYTIIKKNGIRIGLFGIMGKDASLDTPYAKPIKFADPVQASRNMANILKKKEKVDLIICLSHSGTSPVRKKSEDEALARAVPQIDVIISGHTHTILPKPIIIGKTIIVSGGCYGEYLGMLKINYFKGKDIKLVSYKLINISAGIPENKIIAEDIADYKQIIDRNFLAPRRLSFDQVIAKTDFNMETLLSAYQNPREMGLGNMITDAYRAAVQKAEGKNYEYVSLALQPLGLIRDTFLKGKITVADVFQVLSLGLGTDGAPGYPLIAFYVTGKEMKDILEVHTSVAPLGKEDAYLQISGVKFTYNPDRVMLDRVTSILVQDEKGDYQPLDYKKLYRVCANIYAAEMIKYVSVVSHGILDIQPKDKNGRLLSDLKSAIIYVDKNSPNQREIKEWEALAQYMRSFKDTDRKGIPNIPDRYKGPEGRYQAQPSLNPIKLIAGSNSITYAALFIGFILLCVFAFLVWLVVRKFRSSGKMK
jgi:2',3'-cyclic-nucleotide 2'-phosphodiesterase (5'-nucleotidase family)